MQQDEFFMKQALSLAEKGRGWTFPNPLVGAVIVKNGKVIGRGYHLKVGLPHAESEALKNAIEDVSSATLYVNIEPCCHFGRTPPCSDALIQAGIKRIVCATRDSNPFVSGKGIKALQKAGIVVSSGILEKEARELNEAFFTFHEKKRPFIALKFAASLDGKIATRYGDSKWITNKKARIFARKLRSEYQAVLVGINTILSDDPHLGVLLRGKKDPIRIILDSTLQIPLDSQVLRDTNVIIATTKRADKNTYTALIQRGIDVLQFDEDKVPLQHFMKELTKRKIISVLVEGGAKVHGAFFDAELVDKVCAFYAPIVIGGRQAVSAIGGEGVEKITQALRLKELTFRRFDDNWMVSGYIEIPTGGKRTKA